TLGIQLNSFSSGASPNSSDCPWPWGSEVSTTPASGTVVQPRNPECRAGLRRRRLLAPHCAVTGRALRSGSAACRYRLGRVLRAHLAQEHLVLGRVRSSISE